MPSSDVHSRRERVFDHSTAQGVINLTGHHTNYAANLADEEIARYRLGSDEFVEVWRLGCEVKGGGINSNVVLDVFEVGSGPLTSVSAGSLEMATGAEPLASGSSDTSEVIVRMNTGGTNVDVTIQGLIAIVE